MFDADDYRSLAGIYAAAAEPSTIFDAVRDLVGKRLGFGLLTMLSLTTDGDEVRRIYTTDALNYPLSGTERLGNTPWGQQVFVEQRAYLGVDRAAIRWAFPGDFDLIVRLGLGATMNIPVSALGQCLGTLNILDAEGRYTAAHLAAASSLAPFLSVPFLSARDHA